MALDIWVVNAGSLITLGLNAVASVMTTGSWRSVVWVAECLGILVCLSTYLRSHDLRVMFAWAVTFTLVTALLLTPTVTVVVNDLTEPGSTGRVDHVPAGLALPLWLITGVGYTLATGYEDMFHFPDERAYTRTGMLFAARLLQDSFTLDSRDPVLAFNLVAYTKNCVVPDVMLNHKYSYQDVMASADAPSVIFSHPSPLRGLYWRDATASTFLFCQDAAPRLRSLLQAESRATGTTFMYHAASLLPGSRIPQRVYADQLAGSYRYFFASSKSAQAILLQNIAIAGLRRGLNSYVKDMNGTASMVDIASETTLMKLRLSHAVSYAIATEVLPQLHTVLLLFGICIFPLMVLALYVREIAWAVCKNYLNFTGSLMLWPIMFAVFNFAVNFSTQQRFHATGPTLANLHRLMETSSTTAGIAGWLMMSIPFLAFRLFTGLGHSFASLSSSLGSVLGSAASADAAAVAAGNLSVGNVQVDTINGFKTNLNREYREGMATRQLDNGALESHTPDGQSLFDTSSAISRLPVDLHVDRQLTSTLQRMTRDSMNQTGTALQGYHHTLQETGARLTQFHEQFGHTDTQTLAVSTGISTTDAEKISHMQNVAQDYADRHHVSLNHAYTELEERARHLSVYAGARGQVGIDSSKALWGRPAQWITGTSARGDVHTGVEMSGRTGSTSQTSEGGQQGHDRSRTLSARESRDFSEGIDVLRQYSTSHLGHQADSNASGLLTQISSGLTTSDSQYQQYITSQSHTHELQRMASESATLSAGARENDTQQFVAWVKQTSPDMAQTLLTDTADPAIARQREALVQAFIQEQLQGRIDLAYSAGAGTTTQGMTAPANRVGIRFGNAAAREKNHLDARVRQRPLHTDVNSEVEGLQSQIRSQVDAAQDALMRGRKKTEEGMTARRADEAKGEQTVDESRYRADVTHKKE